MGTPRALAEAIVWFSDPDNALKYFAERRWPNGVECPYCQTRNPMFLANRHVWKCRATRCRKQFSVKVGSIFEDSPLGLDKWLPCVWLISNSKDGVSSYEIAREFNVTQKTAWFMLHRVREAMQDKTNTKLSGTVEVGDSFIGGKSKSIRKDRRERAIAGTGGKDKAIALGMVERGKVLTFAAETRRKHEPRKRVRETVQAGSALCSDALRSYDGLDPNTNAPS